MQAPKMICYKDVFTATLSVALVPEGMPTAFDHWIMRSSGAKVMRSSGA